MSKFCTNCGAQLSDKQVYCIKCGVIVNPEMANNQNMYNNMNPGMNMGYGPYQPSNTTNSMCIVGFVLSFMQPVVGIILSIIGLNQVKKSGESGAGLATAGIIIGSILTALIVIYFIFWIFVFATLY